jgi:hypothetical protein
LARSIELDSKGARAVKAGERASGLAEILERYAVVVLVVLAAVGFGLRVWGISNLGLAEDEINKLEAVRAYDRGDFTENAEHPMLMKVLIYASVRVADKWNARAGSVRGAKGAPPACSTSATRRPCASPTSSSVR